MSIDGSFNIGFQDEDVVLKKDNVESFRTSSNGFLITSGHIYFSDLNTYITNQGTSNGFDFVVNNNTVMQTSGSETSGSGTISIGGTASTDVLNIHGSTSASLGFSSEVSGTLGFSISLEGNDLIFDNKDNSTYLFNSTPSYNNPGNTGLYFTPMANGSVSQIGIGSYNSTTTYGRLAVLGSQYNRSIYIEYMNGRYWNAYYSTGFNTTAAGTYIVGSKDRLDMVAYSVGHIVASTFSCFSDKRIKKNIFELNKNSSLEKIRNLKPSYYHRIDFLDKGTSQKIGFIAQEVENILPETSKITYDYIPNIYKAGDCVLDFSNNYILTIHDFDTKDLLVDLSNNYLPLSLHNEDYHIVRNISICEVISSNKIRIDSNGEDISKMVIVYGQEVDDFHVLEYEHVFTHATAALQEVDRLLQSQRSRNEKLENKLRELQNRAKYLVNN